jgi:two-component system, OmpR family, response regulator
VQSRTARALVVDDEENVSYLASAALRLNGWTVQVSDNGQEALAAADTFRPM